MTNPPKTKNDETKTANAAISGKVISKISDSKIDQVINSLDQDELNQVMKYVFKAMATGENCSSLLKWHEKLVAKVNINTSKESSFL